jgi:LPXTG-site transpeptidase (sortase) family protein
MSIRPNSIFNLFTLCAVLLSLIGVAVIASPAQAQSFNASNATELIQAINDANTNGQDDTITLTADIVLTAVDNTTDGVNGLPSILSDGGHSLTIEGNGFSISRSGGTAFRIIHIATGANVFIRNVSIENGLASASALGTLGAGIYSAGTLTVENSTFSGNTATTISGLGAGIFMNRGNLTLRNSYFTSNSGAMGVAVYNYQNTATITGNTFAGNTATNGGGAIGDENSNTTLINNTFSGNQAPSGNGGAIYRLGGTSVMTNNTVTGNTAGSGGGGGIYNLMGTMTLHNNIIAGNTAPVSAECYNDTTISGSVMNGNSFNLFGVNGNAGGCPAGASDVVPTVALNSIINNSLSNNGGPTLTLAIFTGSPALDAAGNGNCPSTDQRGVPRPQNGICDIGAFEFGASLPPVVTNVSLPGPIPLLESQSIAIGITQIIVRFDQDVTSGGGATAADNPSNYLLVRAAGNGFQTRSCAGGVTGADVNISIDSATYTNNGGSGPFEATLNINGGNPLPAGMYNLFVCGTTSITNIMGEELNGGWIDFDQGFSVVTQQVPTATAISATAIPATATPLAGTESGSTNSGSVSASSALPNTGFAPNRITSLPKQPADRSYSQLGDLWLEIPALNVQADIVGVSKSENEWDVSWLGNNIGWLNDTAFPTWEGNSVLTAHVTNASGLPGIFANLKGLQYGDQIIIHLSGQKYIFEVSQSKLVRPNTTAFAFEDLEDKSYLTLITCQGYNSLNDTYLFRRVVRAVLVSVENE